MTEESKIVWHIVRLENNRINWHLNIFSDAQWCLQSRSPSPRSIEHEPHPRYGTSRLDHIWNFQPCSHLELSDWPRVFRLTLSASSWPHSCSFYFKLRMSLPPPAPVDGNSFESGISTGLPKKHFKLVLKEPEKKAPKHVSEKNLTFQSMHQSSLHEKIQKLVVFSYTYVTVYFHVFILDYIWDGGWRR